MSMHEQGFHPEVVEEMNIQGEVRWVAFGEPHGRGRTVVANRGDVPHDVMVGDDLDNGWIAGSVSAWVPCRVTIVPLPKSEAVFERQKRDEQ